AFVKEGDQKIRERVAQCTDQRIFAIYQALKRKLLTVEEIHEITKIDEWFLWKLENIASDGEAVKTCETGFERVSAKAEPEPLHEETEPSHEKNEMLYPPRSFKMVDTCAGEFDAETPYFYSVTGGENEAEEFISQ
ncbi:MAG: hypothetical protein IJ257_00515, partial [Treponema sp.]|nr:hypothetical protein [Treponema sp.]